MKSKTKFKISKIFGMSFLVFWQLETWFFIIRDGWHLKAMSREEIACDAISTILLQLSVIFFVWLLFDLIQVHLNEEKKNDEKFTGLRYH